MSHHIAFTSWRYGPTSGQKDGLRRLVGLFPPDTIYMHGGCIGGDTFFHGLVMEYALRPSKQVQVYLALVDKKWQGELREPYALMRPTLPPLERDRLMVERASLLIACPQQLAEQRRGGTWATIRYARKEGCPVIIIDP